MSAAPLSAEDLAAESGRKVTFRPSAEEVEARVLPHRSRAASAGNAKDRRAYAGGPSAKAGIKNFLSADLRRFTQIEFEDSVFGDGTRSGEICVNLRNLRINSSLVPPGKQRR
jgi:hypothetical protein